MGPKTVGPKTVTPKQRLNRLQPPRTQQPSQSRQEPSRRYQNLLPPPQPRIRMMSPASSTAFSPASAPNSWKKSPAKWPRRSSSLSARHSSRFYAGITTSEAAAPFVIFERCAFHPPEAKAFSSRSSSLYRRTASLHLHEEQADSVPPDG